LVPYLCNGSDPTVIANLNCTVDMLGLKAATGLSVDNLIRVKVRAMNAKGWGPYSQFNSAGPTIQFYPGKMAPVTNDPSLSTSTNLYLVWPIPSSSIQTGGTRVAIT